MLYLCCVYFVCVCGFIIVILSYFEVLVLFYLFFIIILVKYVYLLVKDREGLIWRGVGEQLTSNGESEAVLWICCVRKMHFIKRK